MPQTTEMFWAFIAAIFCASTLAIIGHVMPGQGSEQIFRISDALVTGALGFFAGRAMSGGGPTRPA